MVAVVNDAGSAGKTTTVVTLAAILAARGRRVCVVDLDSQANATRWLGLDPDLLELTMADLLLRRAEPEQVLVPTNTAGVTLLPASAALKSHRIELGRITGAEQRLRMALAGHDADVVLIDCQAGAGELLPVAAMVAATHVITVTLPATKEMEGIPRVEEMVAEVADAYNPDLTLAAIVPCKVPPANRGRIYTEAMRLLRTAYGPLVTPSVRDSVTAVAAYDHRQPLPAHAATAAVTSDYEAVADHLIAVSVL